MPGSFICQVKVPILIILLFVFVMAFRLVFLTPVIAAILCWRKGFARTALRY